jgi:hypothetical protein
MDAKSDRKQVTLIGGKFKYLRGNTAAITFVYKNFRPKISPSTGLKLVVIRNINSVSV